MSLLTDKVPSISYVQERACKKYTSYCGKKVLLCLQRAENGEWVDITEAEQERVKAIELQREAERAVARQKEEERAQALEQELAQQEDAPW